MGGRKVPRGLARCPGLEGERPPIPGGWSGIPQPGGARLALGTLSILETVRVPGAARTAGIYLSMATASHRLPSPPCWCDPGVATVA